MWSGGLKVGGCPQCLCRSKMYFIRYRKLYNFYNQFSWIITVSLWIKNHRNLVVVIFCSLVKSSRATLSVFCFISEHLSSANALTQVFYTRYFFLILSLRDSRVPKTWLKANPRSPKIGALCRFSFYWRR